MYVWRRAAIFDGLHANGSYYYLLRSVTGVTLTVSEQRLADRADRTRE
jgi:hypothetical protein